MLPERPATDDVKQGLLSYLGHRYPGREGLRLDGWERLSNGWECDVHGFRSAYRQDGAAHAQDLVLRIYEGKDSTLFPGRFAREYAVMKRLWRDGFPVPAVHLFEDDHSHLGAPFMLMDRIKGQLMNSLWRRLAERDRDLLSVEYCALLARLHRLDPRPYVQDLGISSGDDPVRAQINLLESLTGPAGIAGGPALAWINDRSRSVDRTAPSVVHWDYHTSNVLVDEDRRLFVIDWTGAAVTDYRFDIASSLIFLPDDDTRNRFVSAYRQVSGRDVADLDFFSATACFRRLALIAAVLAGGAGVLGLRPGLEHVISPHIANHVGGLNARLEQLTGHRVPGLPGEQ